MLCILSTTPVLAGCAGCSASLVLHLYWPDLISRMLCILSTVPLLAGSSTSLISRLYWPDVTGHWKLQKPHIYGAHLLTRRCIYLFGIAVNQPLPEIPNGTKFKLATCRSLQSNALTTTSWGTPLMRKK